MQISKRFLAVFGPKSAGKTVYLSSLYGSAGGDGPDAVAYHISAGEDADDTTHSYLKRNWLKLSQQQWPDGTVFDELKRLQFQFTANEVHYSLVIPDVAGEIAGRATQSDDWKTAESELKAKILEQYKDYDGYLIFVPADPSHTRRSQEFKWEVDALLTALKERTPDGGMVRRPVAVVVSKWDTVSVSPGPRKEEQTRAEEYFQEFYPELASGLRATCHNLSVFPVSATGALDNFRPPNPLHPYNLESPLIWILQVTDRVRLEIAEAYLQENSDTIFARVRSGSKTKYYDVALDKFEKVLNEVPRGELADKAQQTVKDLKGRYRKRLLTRIFYRLAIAVLLVMAVCGSWDWYGYDYIRTQLNAPTLNDEPDHTITTSRHYLNNRWHWFARLCGWKEQLRTDTDAYEQRYEAHAFDQLKSLPLPLTQEEAQDQLDQYQTFRNRFKHSASLTKLNGIENKTRRVLDNLKAASLLADIESLSGQNPTGVQRDALVKLCKGFLDAYSDTPSAQRVRSLLAELLAQKARVDKNTKFAELEKILARDAADPWKQFRHCQDWLAVNQENPHKPAVEEYRDDSLKAADDAAWNGIEHFAGKYPTQHANIIRQLQEDYLDRPHFLLHRNAAVRKKEQQLTAWDKSSYERIRNRALADPTPENILAIRDLCKEYLRQGQRSCAMRARVEQWLDWFNGLQAGKSFTVVLDSVTVKKNSRWHGKFFYPDVFVTVKVNQTLVSTGPKELSIEVPGRGFPKSQMGTYDWKWGDKDVLISITCLDYSNERLDARIIEDAFSLRHLNGKRKFDGGRIEVILSCPLAVPPQFPKYKAK